MRATCRNSHCGQQQEHKLWNQKAAETGRFLFGRMAASYNYEQGSLLQQR